jgi:hypothetical protein
MPRQARLDAPGILHKVNDAIKSKDIERLRNILLKEKLSAAR